MTRYLLDSDSVIDYLKGFSGTVTLLQGLDAQGETPCSCDITVAEVYAGLDEPDRGRAERLLRTLEFLPATHEAARTAGEWRYIYKRQGRILSTTDCLIAAIALEYRATIVTGNIRHFPMPELTLLPLP